MYLEDVVDDVKNGVSMISLSLDIVWYVFINRRKWIKSDLFVVGLNFGVVFLEWNSIKG